MAGFTTITTADVTTAALKSVLTIIGTATVRAGLNTLIIGPGSSSAPVDQSAVYDIRRFTADGTGTAVTPQGNDGVGAAPLSSSKYNYTAEPTYTAGSILLRIGLNMRANYQWYANIGREKYSLAAAANGLGLQCFATSAGFPSQATLEWTE